MQNVYLNITAVMLIYMQILKKLTFGVSFASCNNIINLIPSIQNLPPTFIYSHSNCFYSFACGTIFLHYIRIDRSYLQRLLNGKIIVLKNMKMLVKKIHLAKSFLRAPVYSHRNSLPNLKLLFERRRLCGFRVSECLSECLSAKKSP